MLRIELTVSNAIFAEIRGRPLFNYLDNISIYGKIKVATAFNSKRRLVFLK
jgi:hypothetical protein